MFRLTHSDELFQKYRLTSGVECADCGFSFHDDFFGFYFNTEHGQIEDYVVTMIDGYSDAPIRGYVHSAYCKDCNKFISTYIIDKLNDEYDMEAAYYITRLLLPRQLDFARKRLDIYKSIAEKIKADDLGELEKDLKINEGYYKDLFSGLENYSTFKELLDDEDFDIGEYVDVYEKEVYRLENTVYSINKGDESCNVTLEGEKLPIDVCPNCRNIVEEVVWNDDDPCPKCGGKNWMYIIGVDF